MNLVEIPFCRLTDNRPGRGKKPNRQSNIIYLSEDKSYRLEAGSGSGLPSAYAERTLLALLWMHNKQNSFQSPKFQFAIRELVDDYMYPHSKSRRAGKELKRATCELERIAATRIIHDKWWVPSLKTHRPANFSIIDYIVDLTERDDDEEEPDQTSFIENEVIQAQKRGGRRRKKVYEIRWGELFYQSIKENYTKRLDMKFLLSLERPIDIRLFRWLDRQLARKRKETVKSCRRFAKYKLAMESEKLMRGGRTASSYVTDQVEASMIRLQARGLKISLTVDKSRDDFRYIFERVPKQARTKIIDPADTLVEKFYELLHGSSEGITITRKEHDLALAWIDKHGEPIALEMLNHAIEQARKFKSEDEIQSFFYLKGFENGARSAVNRSRHPKKQETELLDLETLWQEYRTTMISKAEDELTHRDYKNLEAEAKEQAKHSLGRAGRPNKAFVSAFLEEALLKRVAAMGEELFKEKYLAGEMTLQS